jgi:hypothetical protein
VFVIHSVRYSDKEILCQRNNDADNISEDIFDSLGREVKINLLKV